MAFITRDFYLRANVVQIAQELLGKQLVTLVEGKLTSGIICETEAYAGTTDRASHAFGGRRTKRTEIMYADGGIAYVYQCYGIHSLFNIVTNIVEVPHAVLIRGIIPAEGIETMLQRTGKVRVPKNFGIGPGNVTRMLGIHFSHTGTDLVKVSGGGHDPVIWIEDSDHKVNPALTYHICRF